MIQVEWIQIIDNFAYIIRLVKSFIYMDVFLSIILKLKPAFVDWLWPPNKLKGECKLNHMKMIRGKAFMEGRAPSCEANAINATGCNSINS